MPNEITKAGGTLRPLAELETTIRAAAMMELQGALTVGVCLTEAKAQLGHGEWLPWLRKMEISPSYAERRMRLALEIPPESSLARLNYSQAMAVMALPAGEREEFARENGIGDKTAAEIKKLIRERDQEKKRADANQENFLRVRDRADHLEEELQKAKENADIYQDSACHWKHEADYRAQRIEELRNAAPKTVTVHEVPDDYQQLKAAAARHGREMEEAAQAAEEAERRAAAAEAELARMRRESAGQPDDRFSAVQGAVNTFLMAVQLLPYDRTEICGMYNRQRYAALVQSIRSWCDEMAEALEGGTVDAEGAVI